MFYKRKEISFLIYLGQESGNLQTPACRSSHSNNAAGEVCKHFFQEIIKTHILFWIQRRPNFRNT